MRIGWLVDESSNPGGAELTQAEFRDATPDGVEIVDCPPGEVVKGCDRYVVQNCVRYTVDDLKRLEGKPVTKVWHDVGPWVQPGVREWLDANARPICCSPLQADYMGFTDALTIPPPIDLQRFMDAGARMNGDRSGTCSIGSWRNYGKAPHKVIEWGVQNGQVDFFGEGVYAPASSRPVAYEDMPALLASYERFVFLPVVIEPFGRLVAEAWASGCEVVTNGLVGAKWWIENDPDALETAAQDFWQAVLA